ncbi:MAG TPA: DUF1697 domain-containing protein [Chitinophagaceae bacterium]|nr:DUF1697 domain-containing protein [Chitinophagaceae bacterium]
MTTFISILRGINLGGHNTVKMDALRKLFIDLGFVNVQTYIQSGNVIYQSKKLEARKINQAIENNIKQKFGFDVPVITLTLEELIKIAKSNPFSKDKTRDTSFFHVTFLSDKPKVNDVNKIKENDFKPDEFKEIDKVIYLYCPNGYGRTKLSNSFFENKLKVSATTRNWKVTSELISIAKEMTQS